jgi:DNA-binding beta-propeller fold protein YncE
MKPLLSIILLAGAVAFSCQQKKQETTETAAKDTVATPPPPPVTLKLKWETDSSLTTNESVIYDKDKDVLYVANINGDPAGKDGNGFISKVSLDGKITQLKWAAKGLDAPKGLGLANGKLYVSDIDRVHEIDPASGKITKTYKVKGAKFLNDITTSADGKVYVSDSGAGIISVIEKGKLTTFLDNLQGGPNGLLALENQLLMLAFEGKTLSSIDLGTNKSL